MCAGTMTREISAGGVVLREIDGVPHVALIEPQKSEPQKEEKENGDTPPAKAPRKRSRAVLCLPKGLVDAGEKAEAAAIREVCEETGIVAESITKLVDIKYTYVRTWGDGERVFKIVSFYLMKYVSGEIDDVTAEMRIEVKRAVWIPLRRGDQADGLQRRAQGARAGAGALGNLRAECEKDAGARKISPLKMSQRYVIYALARKSQE